MADQRLHVARDFMQTYADGDSAALLALLTDDWKLHEADGSVTSRELIAQITDVHRDAFADKRFEFLQEVGDGDFVAHHARFELRHTGRYHDLDATGRTAILSEMVFHRFSGHRIAESWRMTHPDGVYDQLVAEPLA